MIAIPIILIFALIIVFHELGHFVVAKACGIPVWEFSLGFMRPILFQRKWGDTVYSVRAVPLGGFVRIAGMEPGEDDPNGFDKKSRSARFAVLSAGPFMNFVLAALLFAVLGVTYGKMVRATQTIERVISGTPAASAGLRSGDRLLSVQGVRGPVDALRKVIQKNPGRRISIEVRRGGGLMKFSLVPAVAEDLERTDHGHRIVKFGQIGIVFHADTRPMGFVESLVAGVRETYYVTRAMVVLLVETVAGKLPLRLGGPVRIVREMAEAANVGWVNFIKFSAFLSLNVAVINLLPFPALDGSRLFFIGLEALRRKPIDKRREALVHLVGFALLLLLIALLMYQDIASLVKKQ